MDKLEAARILDETPIRVLGINDALEYSDAIIMGAEALQKLEQAEKLIENKADFVHKLYLNIDVNSDRWEKSKYEGKEEGLRSALAILKGESKTNV